MLRRSEAGAEPVFLDDSEQEAQISALAAQAQRSATFWRVRAAPSYFARPT
jgi:hypothetical protein